MRLSRHDIVMLFGSASYWSWVLLDRSGLSEHGSSFLPIGQPVLTGAMALGGVAICMLSGMLGRERFRKALSWLVVAMACFGLCGTLWFRANGMLFACAALCLCLVRAGLMQLWSLWMVSFDRKKALSVILSTAFMSALLFLVVTALPTVVAEVVLPVLALLAAVLTLFQRLDGSSIFEGPSAVQPVSRSLASFFGWQVLLGLVVGLLGGLGSRSTIELDGWQRALALLSALVLAVLLAYVAGGRPLSRQAGTVFPVVLSVFFILPFGVDEGVLPKVCFILCWLCSAYISILNVWRHAESFSLPLARLALAAQAACAIGTFAGSSAMMALTGSRSDLGIPAPLLTGFSLIMVLIALAAVMLLLQQFFGVGMPKPAADQASYGERCRAVAKRYGLTPRETDVLELLGKGFSRPHIGKELFLAENTVKTHANNIYRKLGIHKHDELLKILSEEDME